MLFQKRMTASAVPVPKYQYTTIDNGGQVALAEDTSDDMYDHVGTERIDKLEIFLAVGIR